MILKLKQKKKHDKKGKLQGLEEESLDLPALSHGHIAQAQSLELLFSSVLSAGVCFSGSLGFLIYWDPVQFSPGGLMNWLLLGGGGDFESVCHSIHPFCTSTHTQLAL